MSDNKRTLQEIADATGISKPELTKQAIDLLASADTPEKRAEILRLANEDSPGE